MATRKDRVLTSTVYPRKEAVAKLGGYSILRLNTAIELAGELLSRQRDRYEELTGTEKAQLDSVLLRKEVLLDPGENFEVQQGLADLARLLGWETLADKLATWTALEAWRCISIHFLRPSAKAKQSV